MADRGGACARHAEDAADANLPLMYWYGIEPLVPADPARALATRAQRPRSRWCGSSSPGGWSTMRWRRATRATSRRSSRRCDSGRERCRATCSPGHAKAFAAARSLKMPDGWPAVYAKLSKSTDAATREHAVVLALVFGDPQALADLRKVALDAGRQPAAERVAALEALIEKRVPDLAPVLFDQLADKATRRAAIRGLAAYAHADTPSGDPRGVRRPDSRGEAGRRRAPSPPARSPPWRCWTRSRRRRCRAATSRRSPPGRCSRWATRS